MPGLYALRSASSSSSTTAHAHIPSHQRHASLNPAPCAPAPVPVPSRALPAFQSATNVIIPAASVAQRFHSRQIVADPLTDMARPRLNDSATLNYSSSGSSHDPSTVCLAAMVHEFLEEEAARMGSCGLARCNCVDGVCEDDGETCTIPDEIEESQLQDHEHLCEILEGITSCTSKPELLLLVDVARVVEAESEELRVACGENELSEFGVADRLRRPVMKRLREELGYNAAICKSRWKHADGLPAGDYEYIDIVLDVGKTSMLGATTCAAEAGGSTKHSQVDRFTVDIDFKAQFVIARASKQYGQLLDVLPRLFVGRAERLKQILKIMSNAAKCSLKQQGLLLPPWRKHKYMQAKWLSPYRRTTNTEPLRCSHDHSLQISRLGVKASNVLSHLDFTKEMDLLFYKAQAHNKPGSICHINDQQQLKRHLIMQKNGALGNGGNFVKTGFMNNLVQQSFAMGVEASTVAMGGTDWQLPSLDDKCCCQGSSSGSNYKLVSGISTALRPQASFLPHQPSSRLAVVS